MYYLSILAIMKNEAINLKIWIDHYIWQGVNHIYIIDNNSDDGSIKIIEDLINNGYPITLYKLFEKHKQVEYYNFVYDKEKLQEKTKWLIVADLDEFFYCNNSKISNELKHFEDFDYISSKWRMFGSNNFIEHPKDIRISLTKRVKELNFNTKYIFQTKNVYSGALQVHGLKYGYTKKIDLSEIFRLNHYPIQSKDFFEKVKMTRGDVNQIEYQNVRDWKYFDKYNENTDYEDNDLKNTILNKNTDNSKTNVYIIHLNSLILIIIGIINLILIIYNYYLYKKHKLIY